MMRLAILLGLVLALPASAGVRAECKAACSARLAACLADCTPYGVRTNQCRRAVLRDCRQRGVAAACPTVTTSTTLPCSTPTRTYLTEILGSVATTVQTDPCAREIRLAFDAPLGGFICLLRIVQDGQQFDDPPTVGPWDGCHELGEGVRTSGTVRGLPSWLDPTRPYRLDFKRTISDDQVHVP
jgi:hypothetical protein